MVFIFKTLAVLSFNELILFCQVKTDTSSAGEQLV